MDYRNVLMPNMGKLDIDLKMGLGLDMDSKAYFIEQQKIIREAEEHAEKSLDKLFKLNSFYYAIFFATALSERARKKVRQLEQDCPELFESKKTNQRVIAYTSRFSANNPDVDHCVASLLALFDEETKDGDPPDKTLALVRCAYPKLYTACKAAGETTQLVDIYMHLRNDRNKVEPDDVSSEGIYQFCVMLWLYKIMGKEISLLDGQLAGYVIDAFHSFEFIIPSDETPEYSVEMKRRARKMADALRSKLMPCTQVQSNDLFDFATLYRYNHLLAIAGCPADAIKMLETTLLEEHELRRLLAAEEESAASVECLLIPFMIIKSFVVSMNSLRDKLGSAERELAEHRERKAAEPPPVESVSEQRREISALGSEVQRLKDKLRTAKNNERALASELAGLRKKVKSQEDEMQDHQRDLRELAELREAVYALMSEHDTPDTPQEDDAVNYPYTDLPEGIICFGGYDQWLNRMQERFPTVRFIPVSNRYDPGILRRAPCIWIQSGYISHIMYYRIINDARIARTQTHYFNSHSVESSSRLLIETMKKQK